ncbi:hypothetical protein [Pseudoduganella albidiflava]|uniref:Uncharacterized protein n=1 Tax=Pseudoduganella albidiflava TaxID=321983 RepID=A0ABX5RV84_9BURK|nr:hypothetical protein [Pseudoduganella albidiflava]QBI02519.1 hypothetical protein EYF70_17985 [Pseudoduganella albidiflava]
MALFLFFSVVFLSVMLFGCSYRLVAIGLLRPVVTDCRGGKGSFAMILNYKKQSVPVGQSLASRIE